MFYLSENIEYVDTKIHISLSYLQTSETEFQKEFSQLLIALSSVDN